MSGDSEYGVCDICKNERFLNRKYYYYDIECECHSPKHFEIVRHCSSCVPVEPSLTKIELRTDYLDSMSYERRLKLDKLKSTKWKKVTYNK